MSCMAREGLITRTLRYWRGGIGFSPLGSLRRRSPGWPMTAGFRMIRRQGGVNLRSVMARSMLESLGMIWFMARASFTGIMGTYFKDIGKIISSLITEVLTQQFSLYTSNLLFALFSYLLAFYISYFYKR